MSFSLRFSLRSSFISKRPLILLRNSTPPAINSKKNPLPSNSTTTALHRSFSAGGSRGTRGHGWLQRYRKDEGGFHLQGRYHYWNGKDLSSENGNIFALEKKMTKAFLDFSWDGDGTEESSGETTAQRRICVELASTALPLTCDHFSKLCNGKTYSSTMVDHIEKNVGVCLGDLRSSVGKGLPVLQSPVEGFFLSHAGPGIVSMMSMGVDGVDSRFIITTEDAPQLDGRFVAIGRVQSGMEVVEDMCKIFTRRGKPSVDIKVVDCGILEE